MPVNMDPSQKRRRRPVVPQSSGGANPCSSPNPFGEESEADREKELADAELKNLWDATEVVDMDTV
jgi:hypothetical protein